MNRAALRRFIDAHAIALPHFDGESLDIAPLAALDARLAEADIVALGETNHFIHEKSDFRLFCARWLVSRGWTAFAEELGWSDGWRIDRYLAGRDEDAFARLPSFNDLAHLRSDRDDRPGGILKSDSYPVAEFVAEQKRFYAGLRRACPGARLAGIDIDGLPGGGYADIAQMLDAHGLAAPAFRAALERCPGESATAEAARLRSAAKHLPNAPPEIAAALEALAESLDYIAMTYSAATYDAVRPGMAFRERAMKRRFGEAEKLLGTSRLVVMGHALHLAKADLAGSGVGPGGGSEPPLGHWLARRGKVLSLWLIYGAGQDGQPLASLPRSAAFAADTLNAMLAGYPPLVFFPADAPELFAAPLRIGHIYNAMFDARLGAEADAVIYVPHVSPLRCA